MDKGEFAAGVSRPDLRDLTLLTRTVKSREDIRMTNAYFIDKNLVANRQDIQKNGV